MSDYYCPKCGGECVPTSRSLFMGKWWECESCGQLYSENFWEGIKVGEEAARTHAASHHADDEAVAALAARCAELQAEVDRVVEQRDSAIKWLAIHGVWAEYIEDFGWVLGQDDRQEIREGEFERLLEAISAPEEE